MLGDRSRPIVVHPASYGAPIGVFLDSSEEGVLGRLSLASGFDDVLNQRNAWVCEIRVLREALTGLDGWVYLEFSVPRLGSRIDAVVITGAAVVPIEFKTDESEYQRASIEQTWDYGLDLKNFHAASHAVEVFPVLVATEAGSGDTDWVAPHEDGVRPPLRTNSAGLGRAIWRARELASGSRIDAVAWGQAPYEPTPTIVQAARALYAGHSVDAISRSDAGARNLLITSRCVEDIVEESRARGEKAIAFVTGVPGAGKTLVGLDIATRRRDVGDVAHAVYLSGNGPLVQVLCEALARDELKRRRLKGEDVRKGAIQQEVKAFIQYVHHFRDEGLRDSASPPADRIVIFDEAQRAWNLKKTADFMKRRKKRPGFEQSEPEFLLSYMDRHDGWAVVICLVGQGQEIHTGEAGIGAWLEAVEQKFPSWRVYASPQLERGGGDVAQRVQDLGARSALVRNADLHLSTSMRSFRAETVSDFVAAVLDGEVDAARGLLREFLTRYPMAITRELDVAREWIRKRARGSERYGLVASSNAQRLKPHAIDVRARVDPVHWFLDEKNDTRSSFYLEDAATEFQVQGLELDWVCVTWDADLRRQSGHWSQHSFHGNRWKNVNDIDRKRYLENAYRVLLTRARQGMILFVPKGVAEDSTRLPEFYDPTFSYLLDIGIPEVSV